MQHLIVNILPLKLVIKYSLYLVYIYFLWLCLCLLNCLLRMFFFFFIVTIDPVRDGKCIRNIMWSSIRSQKLSNVGSIFTTFMDRAFRMLCTTFTFIHLRYTGVNTARTTTRHSWAIRHSVDEFNTTSFQPMFSVPITKVSSKPT